MYVCYRNHRGLKLIPKGIATRPYQRQQQLRELIPKGIPTRTYQGQQQLKELIPKGIPTRPYQRQRRPKQLIPKGIPIQTGSEDWPVTQKKNDATIFAPERKKAKVQRTVNNPAQIKIIKAKTLSHNPLRDTFFLLTYFKYSC